MGVDFEKLICIALLISAFPGKFDTLLMFISIQQLVGVQRVQREACLNSNAMA